MKKRIIILLILLMGVLIVSGNIILTGKLVSGTIKSGVHPTLEVYLQGNDVTVNFLECLGTLDVSVESSSGQTVYQSTINSCAENTLLIDTNNWNAGWYKIMITDIYGGYVEGWFEI